jgi:hypothetical protein
MAKRTVRFRLKRPPRCPPVYLSIVLITIASADANAEWRSQVNAGSYYTDDVALFSVTRRLSLQDDPTQPIVDRPQQGGDFVFEPKAELVLTGTNSWGEAEFSANADGYLFTDQSAYSHGLFEVKLSQKWMAGTKVQLEYNLIPDLFIGKNEFIDSEGLTEDYDEKLTSHLYVIQIEQALNDKLTVRLLSRYGVRNYNAPFRHRDTRFWTLGPHLEWIITPEIELLIGYHYEQGSAKPERAAGYADDVSYINHYASAELKVLLAEKLSANLIFDFEKNDFTSADPRDEHYRAFETVYQGEAELVYELNSSLMMKLGWQHGRRRLSSEAQTVTNNNIWLGIEYLL